jgi:hypothetical protein
LASPLNVFKSVAANVTTSSANVYVTPSDTTTIVLLAQAVNVGNVNSNITLYTSLNGNTELVKDFTIPVGDAASLISGKLVIEAGESVGVYSDANDQLKLVLSLLETK